MSEIPKEGVKKMVESADGRKYLAKLQEKYKYDILQPKNPDGSPNHLFEKVYGNKIKQREEVKSKQESEAKREWHEVKEKKEYEKYRKDHVNRKYL